MNIKNKDYVYIKSNVKKHGHITCKKKDYSISLLKKLNTKCIINIGIFLKGSGRRK